LASRDHRSRGARWTRPLGDRLGGRSAQPSPQPARLDGCLNIGDDALGFRARTADGSFLEGAVIGRGKEGVVLANQSDRDLCAWVPFARTLAGAGYRALVFDHSGAEPQADVAATAQKLRDLGAAKVILMGASKGARASLAAASQGVNAAAVVSLSAETIERSGPPRITPFVRRLRIPVLFVATRKDPYTSIGEQTRELYRACRSPSKQA
jgi:hypothetical protein